MSSHLRTTKNSRGKIKMISAEGGYWTCKFGIVHICRLCFVIDEVQRPSRAEIYISRGHTRDITTTEDGRRGRYRTFCILSQPYSTSGPDGDRQYRCVVRDKDVQLTLLKCFSVVYHRILQLMKRVTTKTRCKSLL